MAASGIALTATAISFANNWYTTDEPDFRILISGALFSLLCGGIASINNTAGTGLAAIMMIDILVVPRNGKHSPLDTLANLTIAHPTTTKGK
jgi:hypothetical protein